MNDADHVLDTIIIGAGPVGLQAAILARRAGLHSLVLEQGCIVNAIYNYPTFMTFFTTSDRLEIGGHPLVTATDKPTRKEALDYYRKVTQAERLDVRQYTPAEEIVRVPQGFRVRTGAGDFTTRTVVVATGYFDNPRMLGVPGEDLPNVSHYYTEAHPFMGRNVTVVGAGSSAADTALDLYRAGARVTMVHRGPEFRHSLKYWIRPNLENRVREGSIRVHFNTVVNRIEPASVHVTTPDGPLAIPTDQTFLLTGYYADPALLRRAGVVITEGDLAVSLDEDTFESSIRGLYVIGSAGFGTRTSDVFIENGLVHAGRALDHLAGSLKAVSAAA